MQNIFEKEKFHGGVVVIRNFFTESQCNFFFEICNDHMKKKPDSITPANGGWVINMLFDEVPSLREEFESSQLRNVLADVSGCDNDVLIISRHSDFHKNTLGGWHNDLEGGDYCSIEEAKKAGIYKLGIFSADSKALKKIGTQFSVRGKKFRPEIGCNDLLLFPVGVRHRGYPGRWITSIIRKVFSLLNVTNPNYIQFIRKLFSEPERSAIFFTFGRECKEFRKFEAGNISRAMAQKKKLNILN